MSRKGVFTSISMNPTKTHLPSFLFYGLDTGEFNGIIKNIFEFEDLPRGLAINFGNKVIEKSEAKGKKILNGSVVQITSINNWKNLLRDKEIPIYWSTELASLKDDQGVYENKRLEEVPFPCIFTEKGKSIDIKGEEDFYKIISSKEEGTFSSNFIPTMYHIMYVCPQLDEIDTSIELSTGVRYVVNDGVIARLDYNPKDYISNPNPTFEARRAYRCSDKSEHHESLAFMANQVALTTELDLGIVTLVSNTKGEVQVFHVGIRPNFDVNQQKDKMYSDLSKIYSKIIKVVAKNIISEKNSSK